MFGLLLSFPSRLPSQPPLQVGEAMGLGSGQWAAQRGVAISGPEPLQPPRTVLQASLPVPGRRESRGHGESWVAEFAIWKTTRNTYVGHLLKKK